MIFLIGIRLRKGPVHVQPETVISLSCSLISPNHGVRSRSVTGEESVGSDIPYLPRLIVDFLQFVRSCDNKMVKDAAADPAILPAQK
ncbi:hypothetical protein GGQ02_001870 [Salinibacter ruber]|nr:hypothetical protein [Salinibacter ruber]